MFLRLRWFLIGVTVGMASWTWLAIRVRRLRMAARPSTMTRRSALRVADALDEGSERVAAGL